MGQTLLGEVAPRRRLQIPQMQMTNSDEVQSKINAPKEGTKPAVQKRNPLKVPEAMALLNPAAETCKKRNRDAQAAAEKKKSKKAKISKAVAAGKKKFHQEMIADDS